MTSRPLFELAISAGLIGISLLCGCTGRKPARIEPPKMDASAMGKAAVVAYDADKDGLLSTEELAKFPAVQGAKTLYDKNQDGKIDATEIADRIQAWQGSRVALMSVSCTVQLDGKPLDGARVELVPEPFLAEYLPAAGGTTDSRGRAGLSADAAAPGGDAPKIAGVNCGLYRIRVTHPAQKIPAAYNTETTLGQEIAVDNYEAAHIRLDLQSR